MQSWIPTDDAALVRGAGVRLLPKDRSVCGGVDLFSGDHGAAPAGR